MGNERHRIDSAKRSDHPAHEEPDEKKNGSQPNISFGDQAQPSEKEEREEDAGENFTAMKVEPEAQTKSTGKHNRSFAEEVE